MRSPFWSALRLGLCWLALSPTSGSAAEVRLADGTTVEVLRTNEVLFPDGLRGLEIVYYTSEKLDSPAVGDQIALVWWHYLPELERLQLSHGMVAAKDQRNPAEGESVTYRGRAHRACLSREGETLWIHLDGSLPAKYKSAGKRCAVDSR